jgi:hypothetical protein
MAVVTDPPYRAGKSGYDVTRPRRRPSQWAENFVGHDQPFDPSPWLRFREVILMGADHYRGCLPRTGSWVCWDKLEGTTPADFAPAEWTWISTDLPLQFFPWLQRGGMRRGEENISRLRDKGHPTRKPVALMQRLVRLITPGLTIVDPFMGSGTTVVAALREGYPCIGIEMAEGYFQLACQRVEEELQQLDLCSQGQAAPTRKRHHSSGRYAASLSSVPTDTAS